MDQIAGRSHPGHEGGSSSRRLRMHVDDTLVNHVASVSAAQSPASATHERVIAQVPATAQAKAKGPKEEGDRNPPRYTIGEDEINIWLGLSPQIKSEFQKRWPQAYMTVEQHVQDQAKRDPGFIISAPSAAAGPYEEQVQGPIVNQTKTAQVKPGLLAQGPSNHSQIKQSTIEYQAIIGNGRECLYGLAPIHEDTLTSTAALQGDAAESYHRYNPPHSFDYGSSQTQSDSEMEETETAHSCGFSCHDSDCRLEGRVPLQYSDARENARPERLFDVGQIKGTTQATIYRCRSPKYQAPNYQGYHIADREETRAASQHPLGIVSQGYYNTMRNGIGKY